MKTISISYGRAAHFKNEFAFVEKVIRGYGSNRARSISELNIEAALVVAKYLKLGEKEVFRESDFPVPADRNNKTLALIKEVDGSALVCGDGASTIVHDIKYFRSSGVSIRMLPYFSEHPPYAQVHCRNDRHRFEKGLSFLDALLNLGRDEVRDLLYKVKMREINGD